MKFFLALAVVLVLFIAIASVTVYAIAATFDNTKIVIGQALFNIEVAADPITQAKGLSWRESMPEDQGMLFVWRQSGIRYFWMNGMQFPLDFVWINDFKVVDIDENVPHPAISGETMRLNSPEPVDMVLELNAGQIAEQGIKVGDDATYFRFAASN